MLGGISMNAISYSNFRQNLRSIIRKVNEDAERIIVTTNDNSNVVVMGQEDYDSMMETLYLMRSPENRNRINKAIEQLESGGGIDRKLMDV
jgi:antitoxin YefM